nr:MAG TPA: hypothetical protein [Caudoviricetes sp.]
MWSYGSFRFLLLHVCRPLAVFFGFHRLIHRGHHAAHDLSGDLRLFRTLRNVRAVSRPAGSYNDTGHRPGVVEAGIHRITVEIGADARGGAGAAEHCHAALGKGLRGRGNNAVIDVDLVRRLTQTALPDFIGNSQVHHGGTSKANHGTVEVCGSGLGLALAQDIHFTQSERTRLHEQGNSVSAVNGVQMPVSLTRYRKRVFLRATAVCEALCPSNHGRASPPIYSQLTCHIGHDIEVFQILGAFIAPQDILNRAGLFVVDDGVFAVPNINPHGCQPPTAFHRVAVHSTADAWRSLSCRPRRGRTVRQAKC